MSLIEKLVMVPELSEADRAVLEQTSAEMQHIADLCNNDIFLDFLLTRDKALVAAHARPVSGSSAYESNVAGQIATLEKEPAVFRAFEEGMPICDIKAETQEGRQVRQNVCPVRSEDGRILAVLIREKDISEELNRDEKYEQLAKLYATDQPSLRAGGAVDADAMREVHHRIKNNLQLVASILNIQARNAEDDFVRDILKENVGRVLSIAAIHDILTHDTEDMAAVETDVLLERLRGHLTALIPAGRSIALNTEGDDLTLSPDTASSVALVITELVTNAFRHGYPEKKTGTVTISVCKGSLIDTIIVSDDGCGFDPAKAQEGSLGLSIVKATVQDRLKGRLHIASSSEGTKVSFDFKSEE